MMLHSGIHGMQSNIRNISNNAGGGKQQGYSGGGGQQKKQQQSDLWGATGGDVAMPIANYYPIQPHQIPLVTIPLIEV